MVAYYAASKNWAIRPNIVLVEGTSDERLFARAEELARAAGRVLLGEEICVVAAGRRDRGGTFGVARELFALRPMIPLVLDRTGRPIYRVLGLVDNDHAGRRIISNFLRIDRIAAECRDIIAIRPVMPVFRAPDPRARLAELNRANSAHRGLDWEIEDTLSPRLLQVFEERHARSSPVKTMEGGVVHHEFGTAAKKLLLQLVEREADIGDLSGLFQIVRMIRSIFRLQDIAMP